MKALKKAVQILLNTLLCLVLLYGITFALTVRLAPETADRLFPYRGYTVITDSMTPTIPVGSLVISKQLKPDETPLNGTIITFKANRFGDEIVLTHYLGGVVMEDGKARFRTHAEGVEEPDAYTTHREDILGTYVFHIPYVGKAAQFLNSIYGLVMLLALLIIWLVNRFLKVKEKGSDLGQIELSSVHFHPDIMECKLSGCLVNRSGHPLRLVTLEVTLYNIFQKEIGVYRFDPLGGKVLEPNQKRSWSFHQTNAPNVASYKICSCEITAEYKDVLVTPEKAGRKKKKSHPFNGSF